MGKVLEEHYLCIQLGRMPLAFAWFGEEFVKREIGKRE
jgi:hypothetical protein